MTTALAAAAPAPARQPEAAAAPPGDRWTARVAPYLWLVSIDGDAR
jgi:hypothetical protein